MCGLVGIWSEKRPFNTMRAQLQKAADTLSHRGPNDSGFWESEEGLVLGHRRLSILDLSPQGHQPMVSPSKRFVLIFNGEIYNHLELKKELSRTSWEGHSDTEVFLTAIEEWGLLKTLEKSYGMFAFALFDRETKTLTLARDRMGEKPLYYGFKDGAFIFGSELKALFSLALTPFSLDKQALYTYFKYAYIPSPSSILEGIYKLNPAHLLTITSSDLKQEKLSPSSSYYELPTPTENGFPLEDNKAALEKLLKNVLSEQSLTDVPLGAFLSGGIDSSVIVALMQSLSSTPVKTFTIGFREDSFNEAPYAKVIANHLRTNHTELYVTAREAQDVIPLLPDIYDEPFADSSQIPTFLISRLAREKVTVSLSGDGGDELFGGYDRYRVAQKFYKGTKFISPSLRRALGSSIKKTPRSILNRLSEIFPFCPPVLGDKLHRVADALSKSHEDFYHHLLTCWPHPPLEGESKGTIDLFENDGSPTSFLNAMMRADIRFYLPNDILVKLDRATMAASLEGRLPFLDARVVNFSQSLPLSQKFSHGKGKYILREILTGFVPAKFFERPKQGFCVPVGEWIRGELKEWAYGLLKTLDDHPALNKFLIQETWERHQKGILNASHSLWALLMYLAWYQKYKPYLKTPLL